MLGPAAMIPGRIDGLYVVDVGGGEWLPVFLTSGQARDRHGGGEGLSGVSLRGPSTAKGYLSQGSASTGDRLGTGIR